MQPKEYEQNVLVTESKDFLPIKTRIDDPMIRLLHAGLGLSSELAELADAIAGAGNDIDWVNIAEESSDLAWYVAIAVNTLGFDHDEISSQEDLANDTLMEKYSMSVLQGALYAAVWATGEFNDQIKKHLFYGRTFDREKVKKTLQQLCMAISGLCVVSGTTIGEARATNIAKLRARYGDKFSEAAALNRNLEVERKILEDGVK